MDTLVSRHERRIYALGRRILGRHEDAEEVVQQTFLSVVEHLEGFRQESRFGTWLSRIATNHALALLRRQAVRATVSLDTPPRDEGYGDLPHPEYIAVWRETPEQIAGRREVRQIIDTALDSLDDKYRVVFVLRDIEEYSTRETAQMLGISENNVKVRLLRARLMLRERLTRLFGDEATQVVPDHDHEAEDPDAPK